jgi:hypothetical protein
MTNVNVSFIWVQQGKISLDASSLRNSTTDVGVKILVAKSNIWHLDDDKKFYTYKELLIYLY